MTPAPLFAALADGPADGAGYWLHAADGVRIRIAVWNRSGPKGTVFIMPGRTEYAEKYGPLARDLAAHGFASVSIDWRGQGLADRLSKNPLAGHVESYADYQLDLSAVTAAAAELGLPRPWHMMAHSMAGAIGLRALLNGADMQTAVFSAPMWGIILNPVARVLAWSLASTASAIGLGTTIAPGAIRKPYVLKQPFEGNDLTGDPQTYQWMIDHLHAQPELSLIGPTMRWLIESLRETRALSLEPSPEIPCLTLLGTEEAIVSPERIRARMEAWPGGELLVLPGGRHEVLMDTPEMRDKALRHMLALFARATP